MTMSDQARADAIAVVRATLHRPLVGDYIRFTDGSLRRISHDWGDEWQHSPEGSFFLFGSGSAEFSGGLDASVAPLHPTDAWLPGRFWVWRDGISGPHRRADVVIPVRVWEYRNEDVRPDTWDRERTLKRVTAIQYSEVR